MSAYIEVEVKGHRRAYIEAGSIAGVITSPHMSLFSVGSQNQPVAIILRGGETIEVVGQSPGVILARAKLIRARMRDEGLDIVIDHLDKDAVHAPPEMEE